MASRSCPEYLAAPSCGSFQLSPEEPTRAVSILFPAARILIRTDKAPTGKAGNYRVVADYQNTFRGVTQYTGQTGTNVVACLRLPS